MGNLRPFVCCVHFSERLSSFHDEVDRRSLPESQVDPAHIGAVMLGDPQPPQPDPGGPVPSQLIAHGSPAGGWGRFPRMPFMWTQSCGVPSRLVSQDWGGSPKGSQCTLSLLEQSPRQAQGPGPGNPFPSEFMARQGWRAAWPQRAGPPRCLVDGCPQLSMRGWPEAEPRQLHGVDCVKTETDTNQIHMKKPNERCNEGSYRV